MAQNVVRQIRCKACQSDLIRTAAYSKYAGNYICHTTSAEGFLVVQDQFSAGRAGSSKEVRLPWYLRQTRVFTRMAAGVPEPVLRRTWSKPRRSKILLIYGFTCTCSGRIRPI